MHESLSGGEPIVEQADEPAAQHPVTLEPIGGWLLFPMFGLILSLITGLANLAKLLLVAGRAGSGSLAQRGAAWQAYVNFDIIALVAYLPYLCVVTFLFFRRDKATPILMILTYAIGLLLKTADRFLAGSINSADASPHYVSPGRLLLVSFCIGLVWSAYFLFSKRVKQTFVN